MAAVGVIWAFIGPFLSGSTRGVDTDIFTIKMRIVEGSVAWNPQGKNVELKVGRDPGEAEIAGFIVAITDSESRTFSQEERISLQEFDVVDVILDYSTSGLGDEIVAVEIYPILLDNGKNEFQGNLADRYEFRGDEEGNGGSNQEICSGGGDEDSDGRIDCNDNDCAGDSSCGFFVFVTSSVHQGNLGGISGAKLICKNLADGIPKLAERNWDVWLSTDSDKVSDRFHQSSVSYRLADSTSNAIANDWSDLIDGSLAKAINIAESGLDVSSILRAYTSTSADGQFSGAGDCSEWNTVDTSRVRRGDRKSVV